MRRSLVALALAGTGVAALIAVGDPRDLPHALLEAIDRLGGWTYAVVAGLAFLETGAFVGLVAPGETVVVIGGVAAARGEVGLVPLIGIVWLAAVLGDAASFHLGRRFGRPLLARATGLLRIEPERVVWIEAFFARHGGRTVFLGRFVGVVRALAPFLAGESGMSYRSFLPWSLAGTGLWAGAFTLVGYQFATSFESAADLVTGVMLAAAAVVTAVIAIRHHRRGRGRGAAPGLELSPPPAVGG